MNKHATVVLISKQTTTSSSIFFILLQYKILPSTSQQQARRRVLFGKESCFPIVILSLLPSSTHHVDTFLTFSFQGRRGSELLSSHYPAPVEQHAPPKSGLQTRLPTLTPAEVSIEGPFQQQQHDSLNLTPSLYANNHNTFGYQATTSFM